ncbi:hypothetical protein A2U01_0092734, partial [Trifolium medium]|nr:hypothetical protein [Trifolium medium]
MVGLVAENVAGIGGGGGGRGER